MQIRGKSIMVTGANRGIGAALVVAALDRDAACVYAAARQPVTPTDARVVPVTLDITDRGQIRAAATAIGDDLDVLVNNAGVGFHDVLDDREALTGHMAVNVFGTFEVTHALLPGLGSLADLLASCWHSCRMTARQRDSLR